MKDIKNNAFKMALQEALGTVRKQIDRPLSISSKRQSQPLDKLILFVFQTIDNDNSSTSWAKLDDRLKVYSWFERRFGALGACIQSINTVLKEFDLNGLVIQDNQAALAQIKQLEAKLAAHEASGQQLRDAQLQADGRYAQEAQTLKDGLAQAEQARKEILAVAKENGVDPRLIEDLAAARLENQQLQARNAVLEETNKTLEGRLSEMSAQMATVKNQNTILLSDMQSMKESNEAFKCDVISKIDALMGKISGQQKEIERLKETPGQRPGATGGLAFFPDAAATQEKSLQLNIK